jgi:hypothetical protein
MPLSRIFQLYREAVLLVEKTRENRRKLSSCLVLLYLSVLAHLFTLLVLLVNFLCL